ncbi:MAG TPA: glycosyltransferase family 9 protein [Chitinolyticbacter sp.]|nr:glycosyltransferase family 9 protein [Chitinolyticbacter sp.]
MNARFALTGEAVLDRQDQLWLPCDLPHLGRAPGEFRPLSASRAVLNADRSPFMLDYATVGTVHILNGMGVALGDSVIGLSVLHALKAAHPQFQCVLYRSPHTPAYVEAPYSGLDWLTVRHLPWPLAELPVDEPVIDLADFMYRPAFDRLAMIDFFAESLGIVAPSLPATTRRNGWLQHQARHRPPPDGDYTLLCTRASSALRSMPHSVAEQLAATLAGQGRRVLSLGGPPLAAAEDISERCRLWPELLACIAGAQQVVSTDTAIIHLAAGLDVPCLAYFMGMDPTLRVRDYPRCHAIQLDGDGRLAGLHHANAQWQLDYAAACWQLAPEGLALLA